MGRFVRGDVVVLPFPFSDLSANKRRPALVLADLQGDDIVLCQITSQNSNDNYALPLCKKDFVEGALTIDSFIKPSRIFTADRHIIIKKAGKISAELHEKVIGSIILLLKK